MGAVAGTAVAVVQSVAEAAEVVRKAVVAVVVVARLTAVAEVVEVVQLTVPAVVPAVRGCKEVAAVAAAV